METLELIKKAHEGDKAARDRIVNENVGLVWSIVRRFKGRGCEMEDLFQIGCIGILKAIDKFDLSYDVKFSTYAVSLISGEIKRFLRDDGMVKVSRSLKENGWKIRLASEKLSQEYGREATIDEIASATELSAEEIVMAMEANVEVESIYKSVYQKDGNEILLVDRLQEDKDENEKMLNHMLLRQLMEELDQDERRLIELRYFREMTQVQVAKILDISQVQVSRIEKKILQKMRGRI
ncbi:MAG: SigF/SigG family RNA polymerase sporulation sigma factor [Lachnospiraceae bacterium]|nr:SigF/SigG family RNA polymerase sporulation sigma factor [Lachnospiraceae bacterium]MDY5577450.1 SigF/SigG family RNA polymerase sporulation sigma factor [Lachnospiraceae bacterium]